MSGARRRAADRAARTALGTAARVLTVVAVLLVPVAAAAPAAAHDSSPDIRAVLDDVPDLDGVTIEVVTSITDQIAVENTSDTPLEVLDVDGVPFLRLARSGVEANLDAEEFYLSEDPLGAVAVPPRARGEGLPPAWERIADEPAWAWFDHRLHPTELQPPADGSGGEVLGRFTLPLLHGDDEVEVTGRIVYQPLRGALAAALVSTPSLDGLSVTLLPGRAPGLFVDNATGDTVTVLGRDGEPFLRFTDDATEANVASPTWVESGRATRDATVLETEPVTADVDADPVWEQVASVPRFGWVDVRGIYPEPDAPPEVIALGLQRTLLEWQIDLVAGDGQALAVEGVTRWRPFPDEGPGLGDRAVDLLRPAAAVVALGFVVVVAWRGRRRRASSPGP